MSNPTSLLTSPPDYAALVAENARLQEELSTAAHHARQRAEAEIENYAAGLRTANATIAELRKDLACENEANHALIDEVVTLRQDLRAAEGRAERIDNQALVLQDQVATLREAAERAERLIDPTRPIKAKQFGQETLETLADLRRALAATAPETAP